MLGHIGLLVVLLLQCCYTLSQPLVLFYEALVTLTNLPNLVRMLLVRPEVKVNIDRDFIRIGLGAIINSRKVRRCPGLRL